VIGQTAISYLAVCSVQSNDVIGWLLEPNRSTRAVLCLIGFIQAVRGNRESLYHLIALSLWCQLLVIPEYTIVVLRLPYEDELPDRVMNGLASIVAIMMNCTLAIMSYSWERTDGSCYSNGQSQAPENFQRLIKTVPDYNALGWLFDIALIIFKTFFPIKPAVGTLSEERTTVQKVTLSIVFVLASLFALKLVTVILVLYSVATDQEQRL
jgi:hypothetical protein